MRNNNRREQVRVLQLIAPNTLGGAERVVLSIQEGMGQGYVSSLAAFIWVKKPDNAFLREVRAKRYPCAIFPMRFAFDWANVRQLFGYLMDNRIQLLHTHGYRSDILGLLCARAARIPVITTLHGWTAANWRVRGYEKIQRLALPFFTAIIAVSEQIKEQLVRERKIKAGKIKVLQNAVSLPGEADSLATERKQIRQAFGCAGDALLIGWVGRLSPEKNLTDLLKAIKLLAPCLPELCCWVIGEGPEKVFMENQARELGLSQRVKFLGFQAHISYIYQALDVLAISSTTEGTPMVLLEAMIRGLPVVSTRVGGIAALLEHGLNGLLVNPGDVAGLAKSLEKVLTEPALAAKLGQAARRKVQTQFAAEAWIQRIRDMYRECLEG